MSMSTPSCSAAVRRRFTGLVQHIAPSGNSSRNLASSASCALGNSASGSTTEHLTRLRRDGVTIVEDVYTLGQLSDIRAALATVCNEVSAALPAMTWTEMRYQKELVNSESFCVGGALYEGKLSATYKGTEIIDLTNGRYDFYGGLVMQQPALASAWAAPSLTAIAEAELQTSWSPVGPGTIPTRALPGDAGGMWHRDAGSLFDDEAADLAISQNYELSCLATMTDLGPGEGATEFVLGSHRVNLSAQGLTTVEAVAAWAETQPKLEATMKAGSVVLFSGYVLHRGCVKPPPPHYDFLVKFLRGPRLV